MIYHIFLTIPTCTINLQLSIISDDVSNKSIHGEHRHDWYKLDQESASGGLPRISPTRDHVKQCKQSTPSEVVYAEVIAARPYSGARPTLWETLLYMYLVASNRVTLKFAFLKEENLQYSVGILK